MASRNDHTGDQMVSKANTRAYGEGYDRIFGSRIKKKLEQPAADVPPGSAWRDCPHCKSEAAVFANSCMYCNKNS